MLSFVQAHWCRVNDTSLREKSAANELKGEATCFEYQGISQIYVFISQVQGRCLQLSLSVQNCFGRPTFTCYNLCWHTQHWTTREVTLSSVEKILTQNLSCLAEGWSCVGLVMSLMPEKLIKQDKTHILCRCKVMSLVFKQSALIPTWIIKWKFINYRCTSLSKFD